MMKLQTLSRSLARKQQRAFALPAAIFLMVILAALAAFLVNISVQQHAGQSADIQGSRAYQAARAGIEWGLYSFLRNGACAGPANIAPGGGLAAFTVTVTCFPSGAISEEGTGVVTMARIVANACNQPTAGACGSAAPGAGYVERELVVVVGAP